MEIKGTLLCKPDECDGNHRQRSAGEDQFWGRTGVVEQIGKRQECGEDGELGKLYSHVDRFAEIFVGARASEAVLNNCLRSAASSSAVA